MQGPMNVTKGLYCLYTNDRKVTSMYIGIFNNNTERISETY